MISLRLCLLFAVVLAVASAQTASVSVTATVPSRNEVGAPTQTTSLVANLLKTIAAAIQKYYPDAGVVGGLLLSVPLALVALPALGGAVVGDLTTTVLSALAVLVGPHVGGGLGSLLSLVGQGVTSLPLLLGGTLQGLGLPALAGLAQIGSALALGGNFLSANVLLPGVISLGTGLGVISTSLAERLMKVLAPTGLVLQGVGEVLSNLGTEILIPLLAPILGPTGTAVLGGLGVLGKDVVGDLVGRQILVNGVGQELLVNTVGRDVLVNTVGKTVLVDGVGKGLVQGVVGNGVLAPVGSLLGGITGLFG